MYLFILESIGTSELILIGMVALIVFGPRKLPQIARTIGKTMADFRKTTNDFKSTWEKEVNFDEPEVQSKNFTNDLKPVENSIQGETKQIAEANQMIQPEIKEISSSEMEKLMAMKEKSVEETHVDKSQIEPKVNDKRSWL